MTTKSIQDIMPYKVKTQYVRMDISIKHPISAQSTPWQKVAWIMLGMVDTSF